jgi:hypothetical protein
VAPIRRSFPIVKDTEETDWPDKAQREQWEIQGFLRAYEKLTNRRTLEIVSRGDRPDYVVVDRTTGAEFGVELTSTYLDDRSVPDTHKVLHSGPVHIPFDQRELDRYKQRLVDTVKTKVQQARRGYDAPRPLILSVYVNEYTAIYLERSDLKVMIRANEKLFNEITPFVEVVFWNLPNNDVFSVCPNTAEGRFPGSVGR